MEYKVTRKVDGFYLRNGKLNYDRYNDFWHDSDNYLSDRELFNYMIEHLEGEDFEMLVLNEMSGVYENAREEHFTNL